VNAPQPEVRELLVRLGMDALLHEAESRGLSPRGIRLRCPFEGCSDKGPERERDAVVFAGGHPRIHCYACGETGDLLDLYQRTRGLTAAEAIALVRGAPVADRPMPTLRVVGRTPPDDVGRLTANEAQRLWDALARTDELGERYLTGRHLEGAVSADLVRFATEACKDKGISAHGQRGHRVALLLSDVTGQARGLQLRLARDARSKESKVISAKGSSPSRSFFGRPGLVEGAPLVCVAEGMADTLAVSLWAGDAAVVVGAAGKGFLPRLAEELEAAGIDVEGKLFGLFPQNDRPANASRREFVRLAQLLKARGAHVAYVRTPDEFKDVAEWRAARSEATWPPEDLARAFVEQPGDDVPAAMITPPGLAVHVPVRVTVERYEQSFTTLCALLDDPVHRETAMGLGELTWCEMASKARVGGRAIEEGDLPAIRLALESHTRSTDGKPLKFTCGDIAEALTMLARRCTVHPVRDWLNSLVWDGTHRTGELGLALGHGTASLESSLLQRWLLSAVSRALVPGSKVDTVLVLVGDQASFKSTFCDVMGSPWFTDSPVYTRDKDGKMVMRQAWIVEWSELDSMRRSKDVEQLKAFLSSRVDTFRPPYAKTLVTAPRHCVIVGTTNDPQFLHDPTGNRRFWPVAIKGRIDIEWVRQHREQLWAEAVHLYRAGERWWLDETESGLLEEASHDHESHDAWSPLVEDWLEEHKTTQEVSVGAVLELGLDKEHDTWTRGDEMRVAAILRSLGWGGPTRSMRDGVRRYLWTRPETA